MATDPPSFDRDAMLAHAFGASMLGLSSEKPAATLSTDNRNVRRSNRIVKPVMHYGSPSKDKPAAAHSKTTSKRRNASKPDLSPPGTQTYLVSQPTPKLAPATPEEQSDSEHRRLVYLQMRAALSKMEVDFPELCDAPSDLPGNELEVPSQENSPLTSNPKHLFDLEAEEDLPVGYERDGPNELDPSSDNELDLQGQDDLIDRNGYAQDGFVVADNDTSENEDAPRPINSAPSPYWSDEDRPHIINKAPSPHLSDLSSIPDSDANGDEPRVPNERQVIVNCVLQLELTPRRTAIPPLPHPSDPRTPPRSTREYNERAFAVNQNWRAPVQKGETFESYDEDDDIGPSKHTESANKPLDAADYDRNHVIRYVNTQPSSRLYKVFESHININLRPSSLVPMRDIDRSLDLLSLDLEDPVTHRYYTTLELVSVLMVMSSGSCRDVGNIANISPPSFKLAPYHSGTFSGNRLVWSESGHSVVNVAIGACHSSFLRRPYPRGTNRFVHTLNLAPADQHFRLTSAVLGELFSFSGSTHIGPVQRPMPDASHTIVSYSTALSSAGDGDGVIQWQPFPAPVPSTSSSGSQLQSPLRAAKAPVGGSSPPSLIYYNQPVLIYDGRPTPDRAGFMGTPDDIQSLSATSSRFPLFGDGHTEVPTDAVCAVGHAINTWQKQASGGERQYAPAISFNVLWVVVLAIPLQQAELYPIPTPQLDASSSLRASPLTALASTQDPFSTPSKGQVPRRRRANETTSSSNLPLVANSSSAAEPSPKRVRIQSPETTSPSIVAPAASSLAVKKPMRRSSRDNKGKQRAH